MALAKQLEVIDGKVYVTTEYGLTNTGKRRRLGWQIAVDPSKVTHGQAVSGGDFGRYSWIGPTGLKCGGFLCAGEKSPAQIDVILDVPQPKVRKGTAVMWDGTHGDLGAWMKATKKGWVPV